MKRVVSAAVLLIAFSAAETARAACTVPGADALIPALTSQASGLRPEVLRLALESMECASERGLVPRHDVLTVIDYSLPSTEPRLFVFNLASQKLLFRELVAHGKNSGDDVATYFSNVPGSLTTSLGLFVTGDTYVGKNGLSLRLTGLEKGINDLAEARAIVMHGAYYVSTEAIKALGRLGRSSGCPAIRAEVAEAIIDTVRGGTPIFAYYPEQSWLATSAFLPRSEPSSGRGATVTASLR